MEVKVEVEVEVERIGGKKNLDKKLNPSYNTHTDQQRMFNMRVAYQAESESAAEQAADVTQALTVVAVPTRFAWAGRRKKRKGSVSHRWRYVLELHLCGKRVHEISELSGYSVNTIYGILRDEDVISLRQQLMQQFDSEFEALYPKVIDSIRDGLNHPHPDVQKEARRDWLKAHGKYRDQPQQQSQVFSAEKMVVQILQQAREEHGIATTSSN